MTKIPIYIHHRSTHHAQRSGYGRLLDYVDGIKIPSSQNFVPYRLGKFLSKKVDESSGIYDSNSVIKELELFYRLQFYQKKHPFVHYLNGERDIYYCVNKINRFPNTNFSATFHKPPNILKENIKNIDYIKKLNKVICVGENQVEFIKNWLDIDQVQYIPHGVDTDFFIPSSINKDSKKILFVGQHLRDFEAFNFCIDKLISIDNKIDVRVVLRKDFNKFIKPKVNITLLNNIDDNELRLEYQKAAFLFLPLKDATACNSILEALACGLPIVTSAIGGNIKYLENTNNILAPSGDMNFLIDSMAHLLKTDTTEISEMNRRKSLQYSWDLIGNEVDQFLKKN